MTIEECIYQCEFNLKTLDSGCVECDEKAKDFYQSVIKYLNLYKTITIDDVIASDDEEYDVLNVRGK